LDTWLDLTTWWVEPAKNMADRARRADPRVVLVEMIEGISRQFESQRFDAVVRSTPVSGILESIRLVRTETVDARVELRDVKIADFTIERVTANVPSVGLQITRDVRLSAAGPTVQLHIDVRELLEWLRPNVPDIWSLRLDHADHLWAKHVTRPVEVRVEPELRDENIELRVRAVRLWGHTFRLPRWLRPTRTVTPPLPDGMQLVGAFTSGAHVDATIELQPLDERIDLAQLRNAVARRQTLTLD
jgi:hypothetical protein